MSGIELLLFCTALTVYHEARGEPLDAQIAVASVLLNRAERDHKGDSCKAVLAPGQFSWIRWGVSSKKSMKLTPLGTPKEKLAWNRAKWVAILATTSKVPDLFYFHNVNVKPDWAKRMAFRFRRGEHYFYA